MNRWELGFGTDQSYNQSVAAGLTLRLKISYSQKNEMGKVLKAMIGDLEPGVTSMTIFELYSPIFTPHPERIQLRMIYINNQFKDDSVIDIHEAAIEAHFSQGVLSKGVAPTIFTRIIISLNTDMVPFPCSLGCRPSGLGMRLWCWKALWGPLIILLG